MHGQLDRSRPQVRFGLTRGLLAATILIGVLGVARAVGADDSSLPTGVSLAVQLLLFLAGGLGGGLVLGVLFPLSRSPLGSALLGVLAVTPYFVAQWWLSAPEESQRHSLVAVCVVIVIVGGGVGYWAGSRYSVADPHDEGG